MSFLKKVAKVARDRTGRRVEQVRAVVRSRQERRAARNEDAAIAEYSSSDEGPPVHPVSLPLEMPPQRRFMCDMIEPRHTRACGRSAPAHSSVECEPVVVDCRIAPPFESEAFEPPPCSMPPHAVAAPLPLGAAALREPSWRGGVLGLSVDVADGAARLLLLSEALDAVPELGDVAHVSRALVRYVKFLRLQAANRETVLTPALDTAAVLVAHTLRTVMFASDCAALGLGEPVSWPQPLMLHDLYGRLLTADDDALASEARERTQALWRATYGEAYEMNVFEWLRAEPSGEASVPSIALSPADVVADRNWLPDFVVCAGPRYDAMMDGDDDAFAALATNYERWLVLLAAYPDRRQVLVPQAELDLAWHAHQLAPLAYRADCLRLLGSPVEHAPWPAEPDRGARAVAEQEQLWRELFGFGPQI